MEYKKKVVLIPTAYNHRAISDVINFIDFLNKDFDVYLIIDEVEEVIIDKYVYLIKSGSDFAKYLLYTAEYIINAGKSIGAYKISDNQYWISVWHGIPYKKMYIDYNEKYYKDALVYSDPFDMMISMSPFYTKTLIRGALMYDGPILEIGCSKVDAIFNQQQNNIHLVKKKYSLLFEKKIILYAPTFREKGEIHLKFNPEKLLEEAGREYVILVKPHYYNTIAPDDCNNIIDCTNFDLLELFQVTDILISDYSSLVLDFLLLRKPVILFQYDQKEYFKERDVYFDFHDFLPDNNIVNTEEGLYEALGTIQEPYYEKAKSIFYPYDSGDSTSNIIRKLNLDEDNYNSSDVILLVKNLNGTSFESKNIREISKKFKEKYKLKLFVIAIREFARNSNDISVLDDSDIDFLLSYELNRSACRNIFKESDAIYIIFNKEIERYFHKWINNKPQVLLDSDINEMEAEYIDHISHKYENIVKRSDDKDRNDSRHSKQMSNNDLVSKKNKIINRVSKRLRRAIIRIKNPLVSIIICSCDEMLQDAYINEIKNQSYKNIEIIDIHSSYYFQKSNNESECINYYIEESRGEYILFINNCTVMNVDAVEKMVKFTLRESVEIVSGKTIWHDVKTGVENSYIAEIYSKTYVNSLDERYKLSKDILCYGKLYKKDYILKNRIKFTSNLQNDCLFALESLFKANKIGILNSTTCEYKKNQSPVIINGLDNYLAYLNGLSEMINIVSEDYKYYLVNNFINNECLDFIKENFRRIGNEKKRSFFARTLNFLKENKKYYYHKMIKAPETKKIIKHISENNYNDFNNLAYLISKYQSNNEY